MKVSGLEEEAEGDATKGLSEVGSQSILRNSGKVVHFDQALIPMYTH